MDEIFCKNLRKLRAATGLTQKEFAQRIGVAKSTYALYETGAREPSMGTLRNITDVLGVSVGYLFGNDSQFEIEPGIIEDEREKMYALKVFMNSFDFDLSLRDGVYQLKGDYGFFDVDKQDLQILFSSTSSFVQVETKKLYGQLQRMALYTNAAHARTDIPHDDGLQKHDDAIMNDDSF